MNIPKTARPTEKQLTELMGCFDINQPLPPIFKVNLNFT